MSEVIERRPEAVLHHKRRHAVGLAGCEQDALLGQAVEGGVTISRAPRTARAKWPTARARCPRAAPRRAPSGRARRAVSAGRIRGELRGPRRGATGGRGARAGAAAPAQPRDAAQHVAALQAARVRGLQVPAAATTAPSRARCTRPRGTRCGAHHTTSPRRHGRTGVRSTARTSASRLPPRAVAGGGSVGRPATRHPPGASPPRSPERRCVEAGGVDVDPRAGRLQPAADQLRRREAAREQLDFGDVAEVDPLEAQALAAGSPPRCERGDRVVGRATVAGAEVVLDRDTVRQ